MAAKRRRRSPRGITVSCSVAKVCRFNKARFGEKLFCVTCQKERGNRLGSCNLTKATRQF